jgi:hypothetical protein
VVRGQRSEKRDQRNNDAKNENGGYDPPRRKPVFGILETSMRQRAIMIGKLQRKKLGSEMVNK